MNISPQKLPLSQSLWLRLVHVIEQREENITRVNSLIRQFGSNGILTDQYYWARLLLSQQGREFLSLWKV
jgi:hypothetical protein